MQIVPNYHTYTSLCLTTHTHIYTFLCLTTHTHTYTFLCLTTHNTNTHCIPLLTNAQACNLCLITTVHTHTLLLQHQICQSVAYTLFLQHQIRQSLPSFGHFHEFQHYTELSIRTVSVLLHIDIIVLL